MNKDGLSLFEKIVIVVGLVFSGLLTVYCMNGFAVSKKDQAVDTVHNLIKQGAIEYLDYDVRLLKKLYNDKYYEYITIKDLVNAGILNKTDVSGMNLDDIIKLQIDLETGIVDSEYPVKKVEDVLFYSINENIKVGTHYNCVDSLGSYRMSFLDREGNYIKVRDDDNNLDVNVLAKYNLTCEYDNKLTTMGEAIEYKNDSITMTYQSVVPEEVGTYKITYHYIDEDGKEHVLSKNLRVY